MEAYGHAKSLLFSQLGEDLSKEKYVVLNNDDDFSKYLETVTPFEILTYGIDNEAQFMLKISKNLYKVYNLIVLLHLARIMFHHHM